MNLIELPELMREHADHDHVPVLATSRIAGVHAKVAAARRRRLAGGLAGILAVAAMAGLPLLHTFGVGRAPVRPATTTPAVKTINGFPEYAVGGHLVGTQTAALNEPISLTVTPTGLGFEFSRRCSVTDPTIEIEIDMTAGGGTVGGTSGSCGTGSGFYSYSGPTADGLRPGVPMTFRFSTKAYRATLDSHGEETARTPIATPVGTYAVAVWQRMPFDQYPLPPRPNKLPILDVNQFGLGESGSGVKTVFSDPGNPLAPQTISFTMPDCGNDPNGNCNPTAATSQTPGFLHIAVNGVTVNTAEFWDYSGGGSGLDIEPNMSDKLHLRVGELVTITITPEHVTGAWIFAVAPGPVG